jgi:anti-anti-sigma factor
MATVTATKKVVMLILKGDIDVEDTIALKGIISSFIEKDSFFFILDFTQVNHVNVSGIEYLNERKERVRSLGGDIKIIGGNEYIKNLFIYAGYYGEFDFYNNEEEAVKSLEQLI